jgi:hypothetical protein
MLKNKAFRIETSLAPNIYEKIWRKKAIPKLSAKKFETNGINLKIKEFSL